MSEQNSSLWKLTAQISEAFKQLHPERSLDHNCNTGIILDHFSGEPKSICIAIQPDTTYFICSSMILVSIWLNFKVFLQRYVEFMSNLMDFRAYYTDLLSILPIYIYVTNIIIATIHVVIHNNMYNFCCNMLLIFCHAIH